MVMGDDSSNKLAPCLNRRYEIFDRLMFDLMSHSEGNTDRSEISQLLLNMWDRIRDEADETSPQFKFGTNCQQNASRLDEMPATETSQIPLNKSAGSFGIVYRNGEPRKICKDKLACRQPPRPVQEKRCCLQQNCSETSQPVPTEPIGDPDGMSDQDPSECDGNSSAHCDNHQNTSQFFPSPSGNRLSVSCSICKVKPTRHPYADTVSCLANGTLDNALHNLRAAETLNRQCCKKVDDVLNKTDHLKDRIEELEKREKTGVELMKKADKLWSLMEDYYKAKLKKLDERQKTMKENIDKVESQITNLQMQSQDLEAQIQKKEKSKQETCELRLRKNNDMIIMRAEVESFKKSIEKDTEAIEEITKNAENSAANSLKQIRKYEEEIETLKRAIANEERKKKYSEVDGYNLIKESRKDQNDIANLLFSKTIENKEIIGQQQTLMKDIEFLKTLIAQNKEKCLNKDKEIHDEIKAIQNSIQSHVVRCTRCNESIDTDELKRICSDCPMCQNRKQCIYQDGYCSSDQKPGCICEAIKIRFLENIFDNMYSVLEINSHTKTSDNIANAVFNSLSKSRDGKLDCNTRKIVQNFLLKTVKKNLHGIIVGGAVKTRCEMDPETYRQLMVCLNEVRAPAKVDIPPQICPRWHNDVGCHCRSGHLGTCACEKIPPVIIDCGSNISVKKEKEKPSKGNVQPEFTSECCDDSEERTPNHRNGKKRKDSKNNSFNKNMRAAQCMHEPELTSAEGSFFTEKESDETLYISKSCVSLTNTCDNRSVAVQLTSDFFKECYELDFNSNTPVIDNSTVVVEKSKIDKELLNFNIPTNNDKQNSILRYDGFAINYVKDAKSNNALTYENEVIKDDSFISVMVTLNHAQPTMSHIIFLKKISSNNYIIVLDKEYEKNCKKTIQAFIGRKNERELDILRSESETYFNANTCETRRIEKALLVATSSGRVNVLVKERLTDGLVVIASVVSSTPSCNESLFNNSNSYSNLLKFYEGQSQCSVEGSETECYSLNESDPSYQSDKEISEASWLSSKHHKCCERNDSSYYVRHENDRFADLREISNEEVLRISVYDQFTKSDENCVQGIINKVFISKGVATTCDDSCDPSKCVCRNLEIDTKNWLSSHPAFQNVLCNSYGSPVLVTREVKKLTTVYDCGKGSINKLCYNVANSLPQKFTYNIRDELCSSLTESYSVVDKSIEAVLSKNSQQSDHPNDAINKSINTITTPRNIIKIMDESQLPSLQNNTLKSKSNLFGSELKSAGDFSNTLGSIQSATLQEAVNNYNSRSSNNCVISENVSGSKHFKDIGHAFDFSGRTSIQCDECYQSDTLKEAIMKTELTCARPNIETKVFYNRKSHREIISNFRPTAELIGFSNHELCQSSTMKMAITDL